MSGKERWSSLALGRKVGCIAVLCCAAQVAAYLALEGLMAFIAVFLVGGAAFAAVLWLVVTQSRQIGNLNRQVRMAVSDGVIFPVLSSGVDEVGQLAENLNEMLVRSETLFQEQCQMRDSLKNAELQVLQAQINPHFLYNSLDMIHWMALKHQVQDIGVAVENLSSFYRFSLGMGEDKVSIDKELKHVQAYVNIQNIRYRNNIDLRFHVPEELMHYQIVRIVFQPLVENCIQHGIRARADSRGVIDITGRKVERVIRFSVADNGVGMSQEKLEAIRGGQLGKVGYGVNNINRRLTLNYGPDHGLRYVSEPGKGTTVAFDIPCELSPERFGNVFDY
jgi:two-component system sensor histidine kinase YesM